MTERVLPSNVDYLDRPPKAVPSERKRRKYYPANGTQYSPGQTIVIEVQDSRSLLDPANSFLEFDYQNLSARTLGLDLGGGSVFIKALRVVQAGNEIMRINEYNRLVSAIIEPVMNNYKVQDVQSLTTLNGTDNDGDVFVPNAVILGSDTARARHSETNRIAATGDANNLDRCRLCVSLVGGLFSQDKFIPLPLLREPLQIHIDLEPDGREIGCYSLNPAEANDALYRISNVSYTSELVEVPRMVLDNLRSVQSRMGGSLVIQAQSYEHFSATTAAQFSGETNLRIPSRKKSIKSLVWACQGDKTQLATAFTDAGVPTVVASGIAREYTMSFSANPFLSGFQVKAGSMVYPPQKILAPGGQDIGGSTTTGASSALMQRGIVINEVMKAFGLTGTMIGSGALSNITYATNNSTEAVLTAGEVARTDFGADYVAETAANGAGTQIIRPVGNGEIAGTTNGTPYHCTPFALDLESFQKDAVLSGIDTETMALQLELIVDIDNNNVTAVTGSLEPVTWDIYAWHDMIYFFNADGTITYSQ